ncbi:MAG TPA: S1/P1 nuclease, partial [Terriglobales bacterium]|nr:S1/P1 nuclease [Terriglobales bacterium]
MKHVVGGRGWGWLVALVAGLSLAPTTTQAWGGEAHRIICEIAWQRLTPELRTWITELRSADKQPLGTFAESCVWADQVRDTSHRETYSYHFINIPPGSSGADLQRDCPSDKRCAPWAVHYYSSILQSKRQPRPARAEALKFVAHFVGDLHQPMHTGRAEDRGGNKILIDFFGQYGSCRRAREGRALSLHDA